MDQLYEITLLASFAFGATALAVAIRGRVQATHAFGSARWSLRSAIGAWVALLVSFTVHLAWGHTPGGPQALPPLDFIGEHRSFIVAAVIPGLALMARPRAEGTIRGDERSGGAAQQ